jgi:hypothetical protein
MPRALTISRVTVPAEHEAEYLATLQRLAGVAAKRGQHLWVFRSRAHAHTFVEFSESPSEMSHRSRASRTQAELRLEQRLQQLATYAPDSWEMWEEIPAAAGLPAEDGDAAADNDED